MAQSKLSKALGRWIGQGVAQRRKSHRKGWKGNFGHRGNSLRSSIKSPFNY